MQITTVGHRAGTGRGPHRKDWRTTMEKRDGRLDIRVSERERRSIESRARRANRSVSEYIRHAALGHDATRSQAVEVDGRELASAHADLKRCGGLLNQYMRAVNRYGLTPYDVGPIESAAAKVARAAEGIAAAIKITRE